MATLFAMLRARLCGIMRYIGEADTPHPGAKADISDPAAPPRHHREALKIIQSELGFVLWDAQFLHTFKYCCALSLILVRQFPRT